jgi:hypothetical protein
MQYLIFFITFSLGIFGSLTTHAQSKKPDDKIAGYRVIRASPTDFRNALWAQEIHNNASDVGVSRLSKYLKIKNKTVRQNFISFQVIPDVSLLKENYIANQLTEFIISEKKISDQHYRLNVIVNAPYRNYVNGHIDVQAHELGSLLTFYIEKSTYTDLTIDLMIKTFQLVKIISKDQSSATTNTVKE